MTYWSLATVSQKQSVTVGTQAGLSASINQWLLGSFSQKEEECLVRLHLLGYYQKMVKFHQMLHQRKSIMFYV